MKTKITRVTIVDHDGKRTSLRPNIIVEDIEEYQFLLSPILMLKWYCSIWKK